MNPIIIRLFQTTLLVAGLAACGGGGGNNGSNPSVPQPSFTYTISGAAIKGTIRSGTVSVLDANGVRVGGTTLTDQHGHFTLVLNADTAVTLPLQVVVSGQGAQVTCDIEPVCETGLDANGNTIAAAFGDVFDLPDSFRLRSAVGSLVASSTDPNAFETTTWVSPLSEFVVSSALAIGDGTTLTDSNVAIANDRVASLLTQIFPTLGVSADLDIATVPLPDLTDLGNTPEETLNNLSIAVASISAATMYFVKVANSSRSDITRVIEDLAMQISSNSDTGATLLDPNDNAELANESVEAMSSVLTEINAGNVAVPDGFSTEELQTVLDDAVAALPPMTDVWTNLTPGEQTSKVASGATGFADMVILTETGDARVSLETRNIEATAAHLHQGYAGSNGPILVELERDPENPDRWQFPEGTVLAGDTISAIMRGETYFNVHSDSHPAGEIRGQVIPPGIEIYLATPKGIEEVPQPVASSEFARAAITLDTRANVAQVHFTTTADLAAAHIHQGIAGTNGQVAIEMQQDANSAGHWLASDVPFTQELLDALSAARLYFNLHTSANPAGELRAQIVPADYKVWSFPLDSGQVAGDSPVTSAASGSGALTVSMSTSVFSIHVNTIDLVDPMAAQVREGSLGETGGIAFSLVRDTLNPDHWLVEDGMFSEDQVTTLLNSGFYVDVQTAQYPNGEIRGQIADTSVDTDMDGVADYLDAFPQDPSESADADGDGVGDNADAFPSDPSETADSDGDGVGDNADAFPHDPAETADSDGDGVGDHADAFPNDPLETADTDADGIGDNADNCPVVSNPDQADTDGDGVGDACQASSAPSYSEVQAIFNSRCVTCHGTSGGLTLTSTVSYNNLVNVPSGELPNVLYVKPGDPDTSYLVWKIEGRAGISGSRMPLGGPFLSTADIQLIRDWITAGANP